MSASLTILTMLVITALVELCVLRVLRRRRSLAFCITLVAAVSGVFWAAFLFAYLDAAHGPFLPRPANIPPPVGSGASWAIVMFLIHALIISIVALIPAGLTAMIYRRFRSEL
jgi:hypothetical protein